MGWRYEQSQLDFRLTKQINFVCNTVKPIQPLIKLAKGPHFSGLKELECETDHLSNLVRCLRISVSIPILYALVA